MPIMTTESFELLAPSVFGKERRLSDDRYRCLFGCSPLLCSKLWLLLESDDAAMQFGVKPKHLLWALLFLKLYLPFRASAPMVGCSEKTFQKWVWAVIETLSHANGVVRDSHMGKCYTASRNLQLTNSFLLIVTLYCIDPLE